MKNRIIRFLSVLLLAGSSVSAHAMFVDNFDSYSVGTWPAGWVADANALNEPNRIVADPSASYSGDKALYLQGQYYWAPLAHHAVTLEQNFDISVSMYFVGANGYADGFISLYSSPIWSSSGIHVVEMQAGNLLVAGTNAKGGITANEWHDVGIQYRRLLGESIGAVSIYLDGEFLVTKPSDLWSGAVWDQDYNYLTLVVNNQTGGQYMYFDDVSVSRPSAGEVPEPASIALLGLGLAGIFIRRRSTIN